jgi:hypothetical protein
MTINSRDFRPLARYWTRLNRDGTIKNRQDAQIRLAKDISVKLSLPMPVHYLLSFNAIVTISENETV